MAEKGKAQYEFTKESSRKLFQVAYTVALVSLGIAAAFFAWKYRIDLVRIFRNRESIQEWVSKWGNWGPAALIFLNAIQIVIAPIPGYLVQVMAGFLFGFPAGGFYALIVMLTGGAASMLLSRALGRPYVALMIGEHRLRSWEKKTHADSWLLWVILMLGPVGDSPFFLAGLTHIPIYRILLITLFTRGPFIFLEAAVGAGMLKVSGPVVIGVTVLMLVAAIVLYLNQEKLEKAADSFMNSAITYMNNRGKNG